MVRAARVGVATRVRPGGARAARPRAVGPGPGGVGMAGEARRGVVVTARETGVGGARREARREAGAVGAVGWEAGVVARPVRGEPGRERRGTRATRASLVRAAGEAGGLARRGADEARPGGVSGNARLDRRGGVLSNGCMICQEGLLLIRRRQGSPPVTARAARTKWRRYIMLMLC